MNDKTKIMSMLREELNIWEALLDSLSEAQITDPDFVPNWSWSVKDIIAHLRAWQQVSIARLEAAQLNREPVFPDWTEGLDPDAEEYLEQFNARIYETYRQHPWSQVHQDWKDGFLRFLELGEAIPESDLIDKGKYPWMGGYALYAVLEGSYLHHEEHMEPLRG